DEWKRWYVGHWRFPGTIQDEHVAMFPDELPHRAIRMFTVIGDLVLDPFTGSGTTMKVAKSLLRRSTGYEVNQEFKNTIDDKIRDARPDMFMDFQHLMNVLFTVMDEGQFDFDFDFATRKSVTCLKDRDTGRRVVLDYLILDEMSGNLDQAVGQKLKENNVQNYLQGTKEWNDVNAYVIVVNGASANDMPLKKTSVENKSYFIMGYNLVKDLKKGLKDLFND
nr:site-specific DNA-methyltransferase [Candidatus Sigynarchaeota archaeon]